MPPNNFWKLIDDNISQSDKKKLSNFILKTNFFTSGKHVKKFEYSWSKWLGVSHTTMVNSGASANFISIALVKELYGTGEVILPSLGWSTDVSSVIQLGMKPVFVDIEFSNLSMSLENIKKAYSSKTKAIVLIHLLGLNALSKDILSFIKKKKIFLIEDCCEAHGAYFESKKVGSYGDISLFSYYYGHHITTIEGGALSTNNKKLDEIIKMFRSHGMIRESSKKTKSFYKKNFPTLNPLFTFAVSGFNLRSTEINAYLGILQLKKLNLIIKKRMNNLKVWLDNLDHQKFFTSFNQTGNSSFALPLILNSKDKIVFNKILNFLTLSNIEFRLGTAGGGNLFDQPFVKNFKNKKSIGKLANVNHIHNFGLYIGNHPSLKTSNIKILAKKLNDI